MCVRLYAIIILDEFLEGRRRFRSAVGSRET